MQNKCGFAIVGTGSIARTHAKALAEIGDARLVGVYNRTKSKADRFAHEFSCAAYESLEEMLETGEIDVVCICTASGAHLEPALACIERGKHCLIEKPLEVTVERCDEIIIAAEKAGVKIGVIFPSRFYPGSIKLKQALQKNRFGDLVMGDAYVKWHRTQEYYQSANWRGTWRLDGGGALMNQGIHSVDLLQWYMGEVESVQAVSAQRKHKAIEVEDTLVAALQFANGGLGSLECSTAVFPGTKKRIEIMGTEGSAVLEGDELVTWKFKKEEEEDAEDTPEDAMNTSGGAANPTDISFKGHQWQIEDMISAIQRGRDPAVDAREGRKSVAIVEAIYKSAKSDAKVFIE